MVRPPVQVVHVGSAARDLADDDPRGWRLGGGVTYGALTTARLGLVSGAVIGLDDAASRARELAWLRDAGVDIHVVPLPEGPVFRNDETRTGRVQTVIAVGAALPSGAAPASWRATPAWSFAPVMDEIADDWAAVPAPGSWVAVAWQGMLRTLVPGTTVGRRPPAARALLRRADLVGVSAADLEPGTAPRDLVPLLRPGARLAITDAERGGVTVEVDATGGIADATPYRAVDAPRVVDPTGAGDVFLAALLAAIVQPSLSDDPVRFAATAASLAIEAPGLLGVPDLDAVRARLASADPR
ncbi:MAG: PfkB family carbohydrate kinase [Chloroflexota bacterium]